MEGRSLWLLRSARYEIGASGADRVRADLGISVLTREPVVQILLPFAGVTFQSADDCLVDGRRVPIRPASGGQGIIVEFRRDPGERGNGPFPLVTVTLWFRPSLEATDCGETLRATVPRIPESIVAVRDEDVRTWNVHSRRGAVHEAEDADAVVAGTLRVPSSQRFVALGPTTLLEASRPSAVEGIDHVPEWSGSAVSFLEVAPLRLRALPPPRRSSFITLPMRFVEETPASLCHPGS